MFVAPAIGIGLLVVFFIGYGITAVLLYFLFRDFDNPWYTGWLTKKKQNVITIIGGAAVVVLVLVLMIFKEEWTKTLWITLTIVGICFGLLTFALNDSPSKPGGKTKQRPPPTSQPPPATEYQYRSTGQQQTYKSTAQAYRYKPPPPTQLNRSSTADPYRELMAKMQYNQRLIDKLIERERQQMPRASLDDVCRSILAQWESK
jgi:hypothetical protein